MILLYVATLMHSHLNTNIRTITGISSPEVSADTMKGGVHFFIHTTFIGTVTIIIVTTTLTSHRSITLVEPSTRTAAGC